MRPLILGLALLLAGCAAWRPVPRASVGGPETGPQTIRLLLLDGRQRYVKSAATVGDSLIGRIGDTRVAYALTDVRRVDTLQRSADKTRAASGVAGGAAVGIGIGVGLLVLAGLATAAFLDALSGG